jgi:biopolymer transport protein ExbB/TolQ
MSILKRVFCKCKHNTAQSAENKQQLHPLFGVDMETHNRIMRISKERAEADPNWKEQREALQLAIEEYLSQAVRRLSQQPS